MSRLIDADKFLDFIKSELKQDRTDEKHLENIICVLENLPTAFDVDKVEKELEKSHFHTDATFDDDGYCNDDSEEVVNLNEAIEIVRRGGIDD